MGRGRSLDGKIDEPNGILSRDEVLEILSEQARKGSISAATALERALRARDREATEVGDAIDRILQEED